MQHTQSYNFAERKKLVGEAEGTYDEGLLRKNKDSSSFTVAAVIEQLEGMAFAEEAFIASSFVVAIAFVDTSLLEGCSGVFLSKSLTGTSIATNINS